MGTIAKIQKYDWDTWLMGIWRAVFSGIGGAFASPIAPMMMDGKDYNLAGGLPKVLATMGMSAFVAGLVALGIFLKTHGAPDAIQESLSAAAAANVQTGQAIAEAQKDAQK